jgi:cell division protein FtsI/penicillin-binding protein 2
MMQESGWRYSLLGLIFAFIAFFIVGQMVRIQIIPQAEIFYDLQDLYAGQWQVVEPVRGNIYDRRGHLLAGNEEVYQVGVELPMVVDPETIAQALNMVLGLDYGKVYAAITHPESENAIYVVLTDFVSAEKIALLEDFADQLTESPIYDEDGSAHSLRGLIFEPHLQRSYPEKSLASNVLGFVSRNGQGYYGVEERYNDLLAGVSKTLWVPNDPNRVSEMPETPKGADLILTLDREIHKSMEEILDNALFQSGATAGTIVVMNPKTGEILAMASYPRMDLNQYWDYQAYYDKDRPYNLAVHSYEPGSVFKVLTMAAALDSETVTPDTTFLDTGVILVGGITIHNWNYGAWGPQTMLGCMQHSLNVCLAWVSTEMGANVFYPYLQDFGFGHSTGVELAGEVTGRLKVPGDSDWHEADLGTNSFGQGISVTPIQMVMAISAVANDGVMVVPRIIGAVVDKGHQYETSTRVAGTPISAETAHTLTEMLAISLEEEASTALVEGYRVAGKTGTAEIPTPYGYTSSVTNASFVGWGPVDDPQFMVYVWLEKPTISPWGSVVAAPVFNQVVQRLVVLMDIPPDQIRHGLAAP